ncbi:hypothetical protein BJX99DRAFT_256447 [Aspergillus californicus]
MPPVRWQTAPPRNAITAKLLEEITRRKRTGHQYVEIADVIQTLRAKRWPLNGQATASKWPPVPFACVSLGSHQSTPLQSAHPLTKEDADRFIAWVRTAPESAALRLDQLYRTDSTCPVMRCAWSVWSKLAGVTAYQLITYGLVVYLLLHEEQPAVAPTQTGGPVLKENIPFTGQKKRGE